jgi:8-oxo-(d)GTP phosphatase
MEADAGAFTPHDEVDEVRWLSLEEARRVVTHPTDREILGRFASQPLATGLVLLVRHGSAGQRSKWKGDDRKRPLDARGWEQAHGLARTLGRFEVSRVLSADFVRCVQTVEPLADRAGLRVEEEPLLSEHGFPGNEDKAVDLLRSLGAEDGSVVACSQGDVIPELLHLLASRDRVPLTDDFQFPKGSVWVLCFARGKLCGLEFFPPPETGG